MSIPVYFAIQSQEFLTPCNAQLAQIGFGFREDGSVRLPEQLLPDALCLIDDAALPAPDMISAQALEALAVYCKNGCIFDFERAESASHSFAVQLAAHLPKHTRIALPARFLHLLPDATPIYTCPKPVNHWAAFLATVQSRAPEWMLELIPWVQQSCFCCALETACFLPQAQAYCTVCGNNVRYADNAESVSLRLRQAETYGCVGVVCLFSEWKRWSFF